MPQSQSNATLPITAVILAGGLSRRMGGRDKGLVLVRGKPMVSHVIGALREQVETLVINTDNPAYAGFGYQMVDDALPGKLGPLAGILGAIESSPTEWVLTAPVDLPCLPPDLAQRMVDAMQSAGADLCTVSDGARIHPVILLLSKRSAGQLRAYLARGERKVETWLRSQNLALADFSDQPAAFDNINSPDDLMRLETRQRLCDE